MAPIICPDTKLSGRYGSMFPYSGGAVLIETGSSSTRENLKSALAD